MRIENARRLTGASLWLSGPGAALDVLGDAPALRAATDVWLREMQAVAGETGFVRAPAARPYAGGVTLAAEATVDVLYALTDLAEAVAAYAVRAVEAPDEGARAANERAFRDDERPALLAAFARERDADLDVLVYEAGLRGVPALVGEGAVTLGAGARGRTFPLVALPRPHAVDWETVGPVPTALVTGTNGKTTTVRLLARMLAEAGYVAGHTSTDGVYVGRERIEPGDFAGPEGARRLLREGRVEAAVLEAARGGLLRRGLPIPTAAVAVVTNVADDHLGQYGIDTLAALADAKLTVAKALQDGAAGGGPDGGGTLVLNGDDDRLLEAWARAGRPAVPLALFTLDADNPRVRVHAAAGGTAALLRGGRLVLAEAGREADVLGAADAPVTLGGMARHNVANALAALLAARALGVGVEAIRAALAGFGTHPADNPGRANVFHARGGRIVVDYGHNDAGVHALADALGAIPEPERVVLISQAGDRTDDEDARMVEAAMRLAPTHAVVSELPGYERGRAVGATSQVLAGFFRAAGLGDDRITLADRPGEGARLALERLGPNVLVVLFLHADRDEVFARIDRLRAEG